MRPYTLALDTMKLALTTWLCESCCHRETLRMPNDRYVPPPARKDETAVKAMRGGRYAIMVCERREALGELP